MYCNSMDGLNRSRNKGSLLIGQSLSLSCSNRSFNAS